MRKIILTSFTGEYSAGGVPRWLRDFRKGFPKSESYSWFDYTKENGDKLLPEYEKAEIFLDWLHKTNRRCKDDILIGDGWWAGLDCPENTITVCHGIWSHLIKQEADAGLPPDNIDNHIKQIEYRKEAARNNIKFVAVSQFIQSQMDLQFGFKSTVINNGIDLEKYKNYNKKFPVNKQLIIHGVNDKMNKNKGWDYIDAVIRKLDKSYMVMSLDEAHAFCKMFDSSVSKQEVMSMAYCALIPSGYEGNSYFALELLSSNVPVVAYEVGLFQELSLNEKNDWGLILDRNKRSVEQFSKCAACFIKRKQDINYYRPRLLAERYSVENFIKNWKNFLKKEMGYE